MKVEDLMIGDWVQGYLPDTYSIVYGIFNEHRLAIIAVPEKTYIELSPEDVQPIPITPEILEKNGWKYNATEQVWLDDSVIALEKGYDEEEHAFWWNMWNMPIAPVSYVHELQKVLRLLRPCGINKKIIL